MLNLSSFFPLIVCTPTPLSAEVGGRGGVVEPSTKFSKRGDLTGPQLLEEGYWERGGDFFQGRGGCCNFHIQKKKSEIFNDKKSL